MRLNRKFILISAAGQGTGRAAEGDHVIATDINEETLDSLVIEDGRITTYVMAKRLSNWLMKLNL